MVLLHTSIAVRHSPCSCERLSNYSFAGGRLSESGFHHLQVTLGIPSQHEINSVDHTEKSRDRNGKS